MADESEAGDVGDGVYAFHVSETHARGVELGRSLDHLLVGLGPELAFLERSAHDADAERLAQNQHISRACPVVALHAVRMHEPERDEPV
jgi:hypothetical protein